MPNRLLREKSPYLLQHAHNPVDWFPWGEEAFTRAREENKPIFLSIGYSTCHWCHVMAHESFENEAAAALLNAHFISIKVDREERPDVDRIYMGYVQATTGSGGWPLSVWLTPDLHPFAGGTYFPPENRGGRAGFPLVLERIAEAWRERRETVLAHGREMREALQPRETGASAVLEADWITAAFEREAAAYDAEWGGFGGAPKFPRPSVLHFLLRCSVSPHFLAARQTLALRMHRETLRHMSRGGIRDHLGGGFHRYSVDRTWHVPHFEKMLYDQAQLAVAWLEHWQRTSGGDSGARMLALEILDYVVRDLRHPEGGFYSAEDADSCFDHGNPAHGEGAFYVWTLAEIEEIAGEDAALCARFYGCEPGGNAPEESDPHGEFTGKNILVQRLGLTRLAAQTGLEKAEIARRMARVRPLLLAARSRRPRPHLDDKIITAWNGLIISALARCGGAWALADLVDRAREAAEFLWTRLRDDAGGLLRSFRDGPGAVKGFADDYAFLIEGLIDLYEATFEPVWLRRAVELQERQDALFLDAERGGYFSTINAAGDLIARLKDDYDGAEPSVNSVAAANLLRLAILVGRPGWRAQAEKLLSAFADTMSRQPHAVPQMLVALDRLLAAPGQIVLGGDPSTPGFQALAHAARRCFRPHHVLMAASEATSYPTDGPATAYVCEDFVCRAPVRSPDALQAALSTGQRAVSGGNPPRD